MSEIKHTPGPWAWFGNAKTNSIYLATTHSGRRYVMGFCRWGMAGAQPEFQPHGRGLVPAADLLRFAVGDRSTVGVKAAKQDESVYRYDIFDIDCADARLIAAAPDLLEALKRALPYVEDAVRKDGGIDQCRIEYRVDHDAVVAAIAKAECPQP